MPVYDIKQEQCDDTETKRVHQNIIIPCNSFPANECTKDHINKKIINKKMINNTKDHINKKPQPFSDNVDQSHSVEKSDSDSEIVTVYPKKFTLKQYNTAKNQIFIVWI